MLAMHAPPAAVTAFRTRYFSLPCSQADNNERYNTCKY